MATETAGTMSIRDRVVSLQRVRANELLPHPKNAREHPESQRNALRAVMSQLGFAGAILAVERDGRYLVADGHLRTEEMGDKEVPVLVLDLNDDEVEMLLLSYDSIGAMAKVSKDRLDALLQTYDRQKATIDPAMLNGMQADLDTMLNDLAKKSGSDWGKPQDVIQDEVPEPPAIPVTETGDLWILGAGNHRILCGDSTNPSDVIRVLDGSKATVCFTDPPYGVSVGAKNRLLNSVQPSGRNLTDVVDDDLTPEQLEAQLRPAFELTREHAMADDCTLFVCSPQGCGLSMMMMMMMENAGVKARHVLIWVKNQPTFSLGRLDYDYQHEPILLTWLARHKRPMQGQHRTSVWEIDKPRASPEHPTMKPVALYVNAYLNNCDAGDVVYDPYCGSGTCIVAAAQTGRRAIAIEITPKYVDVAIQRWSTFAGGQEPILESTGETFTQVKARRESERAARALEQPAESPTEEPPATIPAPAPQKTEAKGRKKKR